MTHWDFQVQEPFTGPSSILKMIIKVKEPLRMLFENSEVAETQCEDLELRLIHKTLLSPILKTKVQGLTQIGGFISRMAKGYDPLV